MYFNLILLCIVFAFTNALRSNVKFYVIRPDERTLLLLSSSSSSASLSSLSPLATSIDILNTFNRDYLSRNKKGRLLGKSSKMVELERVQELKSDGIKKEREELRNATINIRKYKDEITLGIIEDKKKRAIA